MDRIRKLIRILLCLAFAVALAGGHAEAQEPVSVDIKPIEIIGEYAPVEILVRFKPGVPHRQIEEIEKNLGVSSSRIIPRINVRVMSIPEGKGVAEMIEAFRKLPSVEYAEPNYRRYKTLTPDDTYFSSQWALSQTHAPEAWGMTTGSSSIIIAVIDDGIDYNHEEFPSGKLWINPSTGKPGYDFGGSNKFHGQYVPDDDVMHEPSSPLVTTGHGTATAGIAAAATNNAKGISGVSWASVIMPLKVENGARYIYDSYIADAIVFATDNGAHILSMSLGGSSSSATLENACQYAWQNGKVIVASSGNENTAVGYPAGYLTTIAVGATNEIDNRIYPGNPGNEWSSGGSNYGPELDVVAPGINIYTTDWSAPGGGYDGAASYISYFGGTSASCPFVSGQAALLLALDSSLSNERIRSIIRSTAEDQVGETSEDIPGFDPYYGYGRINLYNAVSGPTKPDLTLTSSDILFSNNNPSAGETITISAAIHNNGSVYDEINITPFASVLANSGSGFYVDARFSVAQSFTATTDGYLAAVDLAMLDLGTNSAYAEIQIETDSSNKPSGTVISSTEKQDWSSSISWQRIEFSSPAKITVGQKFWLVVTCPDSYQNGYQWGYDSGSVYSGGGKSGRDNTDPSPSWEIESTTDDCQFKAYVYAYNTIVGFYDGDPDFGGTQIGLGQHLSPVPASGIKTASVQWTATSGSHDIYVVVDPGNSIPESNETNNRAYKSLLVGVAEVINFTITDYGSDGVKFGILDPGMEIQSADQSGSQGAVTLAVGSETNVDVDIQVRGTDFIATSVSIPVGNVKYNNINDPGSASMLTESYDIWYTVTAGTSNVRQVWYWITIPTGQPAGDYTSTFYYKAEKSSP